MSFPLLSQDPLTLLVKDRGINSWDDIKDYVRQLPYGRNASRGDFSLVLQESKGTCSTKHALLYQIAELNSIPQVELILSIYKMTKENTPGIGKILSQNGLQYLPEAHCFLIENGIRTDYTNVQSDIQRIENDILFEKSIQSQDVNRYKIEFHKKYLSQWLNDQDLKCTLEDIWKIREQCIKALENQYGA